MGGFCHDKIKNLIDNSYKIAIESGTFRGDGSIKLSKYFEKVYTIEIDEKIFNDTSERLKDNKNIIFFHGDSKEVISNLSRDIKVKNEKLLFWLDAHWSGDDSVDWKNSKWGGYHINTGYVGKKINGIVPGINQVPLEEEIYQIYNNFKQECVLYIDDFDKIDPITLKGYKNKCFIGEDYSHLDFNKIFKYIQDRVVHKEVTHSQCIIKFKGVDN